MKLLPTETCLTGKWVLEDGRVVKDDVCTRIEDLTRGYLRELGRDASGWDALFVDPDDGRLWELVYPESDLHGGGAPELRHMPATQAKEKYGGIVPEIG
jgi:hypothetical protein